jgi:hypothetical protein
MVYAKNASACPKTCGNKDHYRDCLRETEGCVCPPGTLLNYDVKMLTYLFNN